MKEETKQIIISRAKSFAWRLGGYILVAFLAWVLDTLTTIGINPAIITVVALLVGEITKFVNINLPQIRANK
jgi:hypothetical protein